MELSIVIFIAILVYIVWAYNGMKKMSYQVKEAWADIDVQLKRRYNLIPNIVESVKGYATHEESVLTKVTEARANAINATNIKDQGASENMLSGALKSLFAVSENYPDLKANENFLQLQNELVDTEDKIQSARRFFNSTVKDFNTKIEQIPAKFIAQIFQFKTEEFFEITNEEEKENVKVDFDKDGDKGGEAKEAVASDEKKEEAPTEPAAEEKPAEEEKKEEAPVAEDPKPEESPAEEEEKEEEKPAEGEKEEDTSAEAPADVPAEEKPAEEALADEKPTEEPKEEVTTPEAEEKKEESPAETPAVEEKAEDRPAEEAPAEPVTEEPKAQEAPATEEAAATDTPTDDPKSEEAGDEKKEEGDINDQPKMNL